MRSLCRLRQVVSHIFNTYKRARCYCGCSCYFCSYCYLFSPFGRLFSFFLISPYFLVSTNTRSQSILITVVVNPDWGGPPTRVLEERARSCWLWSTILDKTVEKIVYLDSIFLNIVAVPVLPFPPSPESNVLVYSKESLIPGRLWIGSNIELGEGIFFPQRRRFGKSFAA